MGWTTLTKRTPLSCTIHISITFRTTCAMLRICDFSTQASSNRLWSICMRQTRSCSFSEITDYVSACACACAHTHGCAQCVSAGHGQYARHVLGGEDAANPAAFLLAPVHSGALATLELRNLVVNQNRLVTPYDMHATILAMLMQGAGQQLRTKNLAISICRGSD